MTRKKQLVLGSAKGVHHFLAIRIHNAIQPSDLLFNALIEYSREPATEDLLASLA